MTWIQILENSSSLVLNQLSNCIVVLDLKLWFYAVLWPSKWAKQFDVGGHHIISTPVSSFLKFDRISMLQCLEILKKWSL